MKRQSNFELLRIICMLMVVILHVLKRSDLWYGSHLSFNNYAINQLLEVLCLVAVNCFILISGYFGVNSQFKTNKLIQLLIQVYTYSIGLSLVCFLLIPESFSLINLINTLFPLLRQTWWFMSIYLILYLLSPYLNKLILNLNKLEYQRLLMILFFIIVIWPSLLIMRPIDTNGFSLISFILLYLLGAYLILYPLKFKATYGLRLYLFSSISLWLINIGLSILFNTPVMIINYNFILVYLASLGLFYYFSKLSFSTSWINKLAKYTLGVYLIHEHFLVKTYLWDYLDLARFAKTSYLIILILVTASLVYLSCTLIEVVRVKLTSKLTTKLSIPKLLKTKLKLC